MTHDGNDMEASDRPGPERPEPAAWHLPAFRTEDLGAGLRALVFDRPGERVNLLTLDALADLRACLETLAGEDGLRGVLLVSGKPGHFVAGTDVAALQALQDAHQVQARLSEGQATLQVLADFLVPTCAAIDGLCVGGGVELALACRYRIASDAPATSFSLPEVRLGYLPALGGTVRLPRLIGLRASAEYLLTGRRISSYRALENGLVDDVIPAQSFHERAASIFRVVAEHDTPQDSSKQYFTELGEEWKKALGARRRGETSGDGSRLARRFKIAHERKRIMDGPGGGDAAGLRILELLQNAGVGPLAAALKAEAEAAGDLLVSERCRNLTAFFGLLEQARTVPETPDARAVAAIGILGAGAVGSGLAALAARAGFRVRWKELRHEEMSRGLARARAELAEEHARGRLSEAEADAAMSRISATLSFSGFRRLDLVVEATPEDLEGKRRALAEAEGHAPREAVLITCSSAVRVEEIGQALRRPDRLVRVGFSPGIPRGALAEVGLGAGTDSGARDTVVSWLRALGRIPIAVADRAGLIVNRVLWAYMDEALGLFRAGVPVEGLDRSMTEYGMSKGPLALADDLGLQWVARVGAALSGGSSQSAGGRRVLEALIDGGRSGRAAGRGFYRYDRGERRADPAVSTLVSEGSPTVVQSGASAWRERMWLRMVNEAAGCLEDGTAASAGMVDLALVLGLGFPRNRGGVLRSTDTQGIGQVVERLSALSAREGERFTPSRLLVEMAGTRQRFREEFPR